MKNLADLVLDLRSSMGQLAQHVANGNDPLTREPFDLDPLHQISVGQHQIELSHALVNWLRSFSPQESWEKERWILKFSKVPQAQPVFNTALAHSPWPPDPVNDPVLKTYLEILGWKMEVEEGADSLLVKVSF